MNILPNRVEEFRSKEYWDGFFKLRRNKAFEWYGTYCELCQILNKYIRKVDNILVIGCGNSQLSGDMHRVGFSRITNVDISEVVIKKMQKQYSNSAPDMKWLRMDVSKMEFNDGEFAVVLDKGTLDALMTDESQSDNVEQMFKEIERVLKFGGRFICISLLQEHILKKILSWHLDRGWIVRICLRSDTGQEDENPGGIKFPVFVVVCTKLKPIAGEVQNTFLELSLNDDAVRRCTVEVAVKSVLDLQQVAFLQHKLSTSSVSGEDVSLQIWSENCDLPRYTLHVVDVRTKHHIKFAIFIVPNGRETEWLFGSVTGREKLAEMCGCERLIVVHLNRDNVYENLDVIKSELSAKVMSLAPKNYNPSMMVQFLSVGDDIGRRTVLCKRHSQINGELIVEDVEGEDKQMYRRLIFSSSSNFIQTDARLTSNTKHKKKRNRGNPNSLVVDISHVASHHLYFLVAGLSFLPSQTFGQKTPFRVLVIGLGGGSFPMFLHRVFSNCVVDAVELDPCIVEVAKEYFNFKTDGRMNVEVSDGIQFVSKTHDKVYDVVLVDVDNKDSSIGMSFPPKEFVDSSTLSEYKRILKESGLLVLNLGCRDEQLKAQVMSRLSDVFQPCFSRSVPEQVNEIVYGLKQDLKPLKETAKNNLATINKLIRTNISNSTTLSGFQQVVDSFGDLNLLKSFTSLTIKH